MFDFQRFLDNHNIEYITSGHNVRSGNIGIKCIFCADDPSHHMGISLYGRGWHCWRCERGGKAPHGLIVALIGCSYAQAVNIVEAEDTGFITTEESFYSDAMSRLYGASESLELRLSQNKNLQFLDEFVPLRYSGRSRILAYPYLYRRDYTKDDISELSERFQLMFSPSGKFAYRIIIPVFMNRKLVTWTGRSVSSMEKLRYKTLSHNTESAVRDHLPPATMNIKDCLFDYDALKEGGKTLVVCEGPFDAMRITFFGERYGIKATGIFSKRLSQEQLGLLDEIAPLYKERFAIFDESAAQEFFNSLPEYMTASSDTVSRERSFGFKQLSYQVEDPASLNFNQFKQLFGL